MPLNELLPTLDDDRVVFAGAYHGWGFHEDGAASGLRAAAATRRRLACRDRGESRRCMLTPALYRTRITHLRRAPVHHYFEHRGYSWYVDVDELPRLPAVAAAVRPVRRPRPLLGTGASRKTHCVNGSTHSWPSAASTCPAARVTALLQARVLGYVFNPLSLYWCHDADGVLRHVVAEVHNTYGGRHAYLLPPDRRPARRW